jgi:hypothetical protein
MPRGLPRGASLWITPSTPMLSIFHPRGNVEQPLTLEKFSLQLPICLLYRSTALGEAECNAPNAEKLPDLQAESISI